MNENSNQTLVPFELIMSKILVIRDQKVMLDRDLAKLFGVPTKRLNEQVKRNLLRFPQHFMFQLTEAEKDKVVANCDHLQSLKYSPYLPSVFTEHGTMMLANVLNSETAILVSIRIVEVFVKMRDAITDNLSIRLDIEDIKEKNQ